MDTNLARLIDAFADLRVLVIGDAMLDSYLEGSAGSLCREAPVPIVTLTSRTDAPGGAANTAANLRSLGAQVTLVAVTGDDSEGYILRRNLNDCGIATDYIGILPSRRTLAKHRVSAASHTLVRFDQGNTNLIDQETEQRLIDQLATLFPCVDAVIVSDYNYGTVTPNIITALAGMQHNTPKVLVVDSKHLENYRHIGVTAVKPNYDEAIRLLDISPAEDPRTRADQIIKHGEQILDLTGAQIAAITLDTEGALIFERGTTVYRTYAQPTPSSRTAGAGDTFVSALTLALAAHAHTAEAAELAAAAAAVVVQRDGTVTCSAHELRTSLYDEAKYVTDLNHLLASLEFYRQQGRRIIFTNGCFDILHRGHITYLNRAKALGDVLIVGVNADDSIRRLKGPTRPINTLEDRIHVLAALSCVDHLIAFEEDTPVNLIRVIRPDIFVKGGDYTRETLPEAPLVEELGGTVRILSFVQDRSTTQIIERIRKVGTIPIIETAA